MTTLYLAVEGATEPTEEEIRIEHRRAKVAHLYGRCVTPAEIAEQLGVSRSTVSKDLNVIREEWRRQLASSVEERLGDEIARLDAIEREAWEQWDRSKLDAESVTTGDSGECRTVKKQSGNPAYLDLIRKTIETRAKLTGLIHRQDQPGADATPYKPQTRDELLTTAWKLIRDKLDLNPALLIPAPSTGPPQ